MYDLYSSTIYMLYIYLSNFFWLNLKITKVVNNKQKKKKKKKNV